MSWARFSSNDYRRLWTARRGFHEWVGFWGTGSQNLRRDTRMAVVDLLPAFCFWFIPNGMG